MNPTAFLPLATAAATFVTLMISKYKEFTDLFKNGLKKIMDYVKSMAEE